MTDMRATVQSQRDDKVEFDALMCGAKRDAFQSSTPSSAHCTLGEALIDSTNSTHQRVIVQSTMVLAIKSIIYKFNLDFKNICPNCRSKDTILCCHVMLLC